MFFEPRKARNYTELGLMPAALTTDFFLGWVLWWWFGGGLVWVIF